MHPDSQRYLDRLLADRQLFEGGCLSLAFHTVKADGDVLRTETHFVASSPDRRNATIMLGFPGIIPIKHAYRALVEIEERLGIRTNATDPSILSCIEGMSARELLKEQS